MTFYMDWVSLILATAGELGPSLEVFISIGAGLAWVYKLCGGLQRSLLRVGLVWYGCHQRWVWYAFAFFGMVCLCLSLVLYAFGSRLLLAPASNVVLSCSHCGRPPVLACWCLLDGSTQ